jgi:hypothetical protein
MKFELKDFQNTSARGGLSNWMNSAPGSYQEATSNGQLRQSITQTLNRIGES